MESAGPSVCRTPLSPLQAPSLFGAPVIGPVRQRRIRCSPRAALGTGVVAKPVAGQADLAAAARVQHTAISHGGYAGRSFDLMLAIADVLEAEHGWSFEQSDGWLARMGPWEEEV